MYQGGSFTFSFSINTNYPHEPPKVKCIPKVSTALVPPATSAHANQTSPCAFLLSYSDAFFVLVYKLFRTIRLNMHRTRYYASLDVHIV